MRKSRMFLVGITAAVLAMVIGAGYASAQDQVADKPLEQGQAVTGDFQGRDHRGGHLAAGEVVSVENGTITIKTLKDGEERSFSVDDETRYRKEGSDATIDDVTVGEKIGIALGEKPEEGQNPVARAVIIGKPGDGEGGPDGGPRGGREGAKPTVGTVTAVDGNTLTINTAEGDQQVELPAITNGMRIGVMTDADGTVHAVMYNPPERPERPPAADDAGAGEPEATT